MPLEVIHGSLFESPAQTLVNPVNTVGVMGKGLAKAFREHYPQINKPYREACEHGSFAIGELLLVRLEERWILNFPTKQHYRKPSRIEYIEAGLRRFTEMVVSERITSAAFPALGCGLGGLAFEEQVLPVMQYYLAPLSVPCWVYVYN